VFVYETGPKALLMGWQPPCPWGERSLLPLPLGRGLGWGSTQIAFWDGSDTNWGWMASLANNLAAVALPNSRTLWFRSWIARTFLL